jgi:hypothetical protein
MKLLIKIFLSLTLIIALYLANSAPVHAQSATRTFVVNIVSDNGTLQYDVFDGSSTVRTSHFAVRAVDKVYFTSRVGHFAISFSGASPLQRLTYEGESGESLGGGIRANAKAGTYKYSVTLEVAPGVFLYEDPEMDVGTGN